MEYALVASLVHCLSTTVSVLEGYISLSGRDMKVTAFPK
jgi:hypothetical protein